MLTLLLVEQILILLLLSLIHVSWALGSTWGFNKILPTNKEGKRVLNPTKFDSAIVAIGLLLFTFYYLLKGHFIYLSVPSYMLTYAGWAISAIFMLRAIGDFKYVGFFKRIKTTKYAKMDTLFYSPLCLVLALNGFLLEFKF